MSHRDTAPPGAPCWIELSTSNPDASKTFYSSLFGWQVEEMGADYGGYINFLYDGERLGGAMCNQDQPGAHDGWLIYLAAADAKEVCDNTTAHGGSVLVPAMDVMTLGTMAVVTDPGNATIGVWQPNEHPGFLTLDEPGTPSWCELHTRAFDASIKFYEDVFGWKTFNVGDTDEFRYTTLGEGDDALAGVMDASSYFPDGAPGEWSIYFRVTNADATLARVADLGGTIVEPAVDTPYGRLARAADPTGAQFKLRQ